MIKHVETKQDVQQAFNILKQLRLHLTEESFGEMYEKMHAEGYRLISLEVENKVVAVAGINMLTNFYNDKFVFVYDLVTDENERSKGYGEKLLTYIHHFAKEQGCSHVTLESALHRVEAHRFYEEKMKYDKFCYSFLYKL